MPRSMTLLLQPSDVNERASPYSTFILFYIIIQGLVALTDGDADTLATIAFVGFVCLGFPWAIHWAFTFLVAVVATQRIEREEEGNQFDVGVEERGVTEEAKGKWRRYQWGLDACDSKKETSKKSQGRHDNDRIKMTIQMDEKLNSTVQVGEKEDSHDESENTTLLEEGLLQSGRDDKEQPTCSICLGEYEQGEKMVQVTCKHIFHESCINAWTDNHIRCPLCNYDLMEGFKQQQQQHLVQSGYRSYQSEVIPFPAG